MTTTQLIFRSLRFHLRAHWGVILGAAIGTAALVGALLVGDSVRVSLRVMALSRLGQVDLALAPRDRLFRDALADELNTELKRPTAGLLQLPAIAILSDGTARANDVQVLGITPHFWELTGAPPPGDTNGVILNEALARQLNARIGDEILLRVQKPSRLSRDAPISPQQDFNVALRLPVSAIATDQQLGRFSLQANQVPPFNAFVPLSVLQQRAEATNRVNLLLVGESKSPARSLEELQRSLKRVWQLADAGLKLVPLTNVPGFELRSDQVFLDPTVIEAAQAAAPKTAHLLTYFVNDLRSGDRSTPYSMVTGLEKPAIPPAMTDDEILISPWLRDDLQAGPGQELELQYYVMGASRQLELASRRFRIRGVAPEASLYVDPQLMPEFPGVAEAESSQEWDAGFPIDMKRIREKDEDYWKKHRGTPKAFVTLTAAQQMWTNRFGTLTGLRFPPTGPNTEAVARTILDKLSPAAVGLSFQPVRAQALAASSQALPFGQLFLGFSFFLIVAALVLMALLFQFGLEQRMAEVGTLLAVGFKPAQVRRLFLLEGILLAAIGGGLGLGGAVFYARAMVYGLSTIWRNAVGGATLQYHASAFSLLIGLVAALVVASLTIALVLRQLGRRPARALLDQMAEETTVQPGKIGLSTMVGVLSGLIAAVLTGWCLYQGEDAAPGFFFGAGALALIAGLSFSAVLLSRLALASSAQRPSIMGLGFRNATRRRRRSLATITLLACGSFIVVAVGANKLDSNRQALRRSAGTGGFAFIGRTTLPVVEDLNSQAGRERFGLDTNDLAGVSFVPLRVRDGDDASCLNLNRAQTPRLLGVNPNQLDQRKAFTFAKVSSQMPAENPWLLLQRDLAQNTVAGIGDQASIQWALQKKIDDTLNYLDERGQTFQVRLVAGLANSILQGSLVISEAEFIRRFPSTTGYRMFLIDAPPERAAALAPLLTRSMQDVGLELISTSDRLAQFNAVQNTYLSTFQVLGGLGLLLGSAGLGIVVLRNVLERRGELALLQAVGFRQNALYRLVMAEHAGLLMCGLIIGLTAAVVAVLPVLLTPAAQVQYQVLGVTLAAILMSGLTWTLLATWIALRGQLLTALRNE